MKKLIERYQSWYAESPEFVLIQEALEPELLTAWSVRDGFEEQLCLETATWGLQLWEQVVAIQTDTSKSYDVRRAAVRSKLLGTGTMTPEVIRNIVSGASGREVLIREYPNESRVEIDIEYVPGHPNSLEVRSALREFMPAHLRFGYADLCRSEPLHQHSVLHGSVFIEVYGNDAVPARMTRYSTAHGGVLVELRGS